MRDEELLASIAEIAKVELGYAGPLALDTPLVEALRLDSVRMLTLVVALENRLSICFEEGDEAELLTVTDLIALVRKRA